jgi:hypothetical protein
MKTKIIPFDLEMAKKIQSGEIEGRIVRRGAQQQVCEILEFAAEYQDKCSEKFLIVKVPAHDFEKEKLWIYHQDGRAIHSSNYEDMWFDLVLEVPDEPQFKPFDKVLVRDNNEGNWQCDFFSHIQDDEEFIYVTIGDMWKQCIPYEGNEHLVGTTNKPKED